METFNEPRKDSAAATNSSSPELQQQIAQVAQEKGISIEQARAYVLRTSTDNTDQNTPDSPVDSLAEEERNLE